MAIGKTKKGVYYFSIRVKDKYGKVVQKKVESKLWKTKKHVKEAMNKFLASLNDEPDSEMIFDELFHKFIKEKSNGCKARTISTYDETYKYHIRKSFGNMVASKITTNDIINWQINLLRTDYKNSYLKTQQDIFKRILIWGVKHEYISDNPFKCSIAKKPEIKKEMKIFTPDDYRLFSNAIEEEMWKNLFDVLYWTGVRRGELLALNFCDVDLQNSEVKISKTYDSRNHITTPPKTINSNRVIAIPTALNESLTTYINNQKKQIGYNDELFLFGFHKPIPPTTLDNRKAKYCKIAGLESIRIHDFRHAHVSLLINDGIDDFVISKRLGHSRDMVNNTYGHLSRNKGKEVINVLDKRISNMYG